MSIASHRESPQEGVLLDLCFTTRDLEAWFCEEDLPSRATGEDEGLDSAEADGAPLARKVG